MSLPSASEAPRQGFPRAYLPAGVGGARGKGGEKEEEEGREGGGGGGGGEVSTIAVRRAHRRVPRLMRPPDERPRPALYLPHKGKQFQQCLFVALSVERFKRPQSVN